MIMFEPTLEAQSSYPCGGELSSRPGMSRKWSFPPEALHFLQGCVLSLRTVSRAPSRIQFLHNAEVRVPNIINLINCLLLMCFLEACLAG